MLSEEWRTKIKSSMLINALSDHVKGVRKMQPSQVTAALGLLRKTIPDLSSVEMQADVIQYVVSDKPLSKEEWTAEYAADEDGPRTAH